MTGTEWQKKRGNRLGFLGATFLSIVCVGALVVISLTIASTGTEQAAAPAGEKKEIVQRSAGTQPKDVVVRESSAAADPSEETAAAVPTATEAGDEMIGDADASIEAAPTGTAVAEADELTAGKSSSAVPEGPVTWNDGETAFQEKRYAHAAEIFERYAQDRPENPWGHFMLGLSRWKDGDFDGAETALRQTIALDSNHVKARINLARILIDLDRAEEALGPIRSALESEPDNIDAWRVLGRTAHTIGVREEAIYAYEEVLARNSDDAWTLNNLGLILIEQGSFAEAIGPLARAVALEEGVALFQNNLGMALENTGHLVQAAEAYGRAMELDESYGKAAINLARVEPLADGDVETPIDLAAVADAWTAGGGGAEIARSTP